MNALSLDRAGKVHDTVGGLADLAARRLRFIGDPKLRIKEDYLTHPSLLPLPCELRDGPARRRGFRRRDQLARGAAPPFGRKGAQRAVEADQGARRRRHRARDARRRFLAAHSRRRAPCEPLQGRRGGASIRFPRWRGAMARLAALAVLTSEDAARLRKRLRLSNAEAGSARRDRTRARTAAWLPCRATTMPKRRREIARLVLDHGVESVRIALAIEAAGLGSGRTSRSSRGSRARSRHSHSPAPICSSAASRQVRRSGAFWRKRARTGSTRVARSRSPLFAVHPGSGTGRETGVPAARLFSAPARNIAPAFCRIVLPG